MLILTRTRAFVTIAKRASKHLLLILMIGSISACGDRKNDNQVASEEVADQNTSEQSAEQIANSLLEEGFYQEQISPSTDEPSIDEDAASDATTTIDDPEALSSDKDQTGETLISDNDKPALDSKSLVEDLGFSQAQQNPETLVNTNTSKLFCLDRNSTTESQQIIEEACKKISNRLASVKYAACEAAKLQTTGCASVKGFPILMSEFSPLEERKPQGRILIVGGTHGDELTSVSMIIRWIEKLNRHHSGLFHWHMVPMMNPDGVLKSGATRTNDNGVDLNRNMPSDDWDRNAIKYWVEKGGKDPRKYPGETASSEPETQWLLDEIESFKPDAIISVHAPYGVVDFDSLLLNTAPKSLGKLHLNLLGTYPGSLGNYAGINLNIPVITLELPHSWVMPSETESTKIWEDIVTWLKKNINTEVAKN